MGIRSNRRRKNKNISSKPNPKTLVHETSKPKISNANRAGTSNELYSNNYGNGNKIALLPLARDEIQYSIRPTHTLNIRGRPKYGTEKHFMRWKIMYEYHLRRLFDISVLTLKQLEVSLYKNIDFNDFENFVYSSSSEYDI